VGERASQTRELRAYDLIASRAEVFARRERRDILEKSLRELEYFWIPQLELA